MSDLSDQGRCECARCLGRKSEAIGSRFTGTCAICGLSERGSEDEDIFGGDGGALGVLTAFEVGINAVDGVAEVEEAVEGAAIMAGRRWMTVFTVTLLVVPGGKGKETSGSFGRTRKVFLSGIGGMIREWYMVF